jgi:hypothetical protein
VHVYVIPIWSTMHGLPSEVHYNIYEVATTVFSMCLYGCAPDGSGIMQFIIHTYPGSVRACNAIARAHHMLYKKKTQVITFTMANYSNKIFPPPHTQICILYAAQLKYKHFLMPRHFFSLLMQPN